MKISYILLIAILVAPVIAFTSTTSTARLGNLNPSPAGVTQGVETGNYYYATTIEPSILVFGGKLYIPYLNVTNPTYAEGNVILYIYDPSTGSGSKITVDNSTLAIDVNAVAGRDSILIAVTKYGSGTYRDLYVYLYNVTEGSLTGPFNVSVTKYFEEYPVVAYNPGIDMFAVAYFLSGTSTSPLSITQFNVTLLKFSGDTVVTNITVGPFTTVGGNISYTSVSLNIAPYLNGFMFLHQIINDTDTTNRDIAIHYIMSNGSFIDLPTIVTPGENESLGDIFYIYNPSTQRNSTLYRPYGYAVANNILYVPVYTYGTGVVKLLAITPSLTASYIKVDVGLEPYVAAGASTFAVAYIKGSSITTGYPVAVVYNASTGAVVNSVILSAGGGSSFMSPQNLPFLSFSGGYYVSAWLANNPSSIFAFAFDELGNGVMVSSPLIPTTGGFNMTPIGVRTIGSSFVIVYSGVNSTYTSTLNLYTGQIGVDLPTSTMVGVLYDPLGDDFGAGNITYPTNSVFQPGVFDLKAFYLYQDSNNLYFKVQMRNLGDNPWNGPAGFCLQYIQIYVRTTLSLYTNISTFGLNITVKPGWHYALLLVPGWGDTPVPEGQVSAIYDATGKLLANAYNMTNVFKVTVDPLDNNTIIAQVSVSLLKDSANADKWVYLVGVASYDGFSSTKVRTAQPGDPGQWVLGGADPKAVLAGVQPLVIDIVAPTAQDQYTMLSSYDATTGKLAVVYGVTLSGQVVSPTPPPTLPSVPVTTITVTQSTTTTVTETATQTTTVPTTTTYTTETYVTTYDYTPTIAVTGVLVVIALGLLAWLLRRR